MVISTVDMTIRGRLEVPGPPLPGRLAGAPGRRRFSAPCHRTRPDTTCGGGAAPQAPYMVRVLVLPGTANGPDVQLHSTPPPRSTTARQGARRPSPRERQEGTRCESGTAPQRYSGTTAVTQHWVQPAPGKRRPVGTRPAPAGRLGDEDARESEDLPAPGRDRGRSVEPRGTAGRRTSGHGRRHRRAARPPLPGRPTPPPLAARAREERA